MLQNIISLILSLGIILLGCELFTNGIEWLGKKMNLGDGVVGSIFSAVGTCLPETLIPTIALLFSRDDMNAVSIGIGAIAGAPFMLATLAFLITGLSAIIFRNKRKNKYKLNVNLKVLCRDISFFIIVYSVAVLASIIELGFFKNVLAIMLIICYISYVVKTVNSDEANNERIDDLILSKAFNFRTSTMVVILQVLFALGAIIIGAEMFINNIEIVAKAINISTLVLSIIITPIATELPEKFNSVIWISKGKDTLALGNITGAMVFQSCIPVAIGIAATNWKLDGITLLSAFLAIASSLTTLIWIKKHKCLNSTPLLLGGVFYSIFICLLIIRGFK